MLILLVVSVSGLSSCKKEAPKPLPAIVSADSAKVLDRKNAEEKIRQALPKGETLRFFETGYFKDTLTLGIIAGSEIKTKEKWGIRFSYFERQHDGSYRKSYSTQLLDGSFDQSAVRKIKIAPFDNEMVYFDTQDYLIGSGGGEILAYIVNVNAGRLYYAHFINVPRQPVSLFISPEVDKQQVRQFFISSFRKDFPELRMISKDYKLEDIF